MLLPILGARFSAPRANTTGAANAGQGNSWRRRQANPGRLEQLDTTFPSPPYQFHLHSCSRQGPRGWSPLPDASGTA